MPEKPRLFLIDGSSYIYRAFHAIRELSTSKGFPTNAIYGFTNMLLKVIKEKEPEYLAIAFDVKGPTFRHKAYEEYKAHRPEMPDDLLPQLPYIREIVEAFNIPVLEIQGYEADDIIGTIAKRASAQGFDVTIVTGDKDIFQLIGENIHIYDTMKEKVYGENEVKERFGVEPERVVEVMGLMGDAVDNIPGVPGVGEKTAVELIKEFGTIDNLFAHLDEVKKPKLKESLREYAEQALLSRKLATIDTDCPVEIEPSELRRMEPKAPDLIRLCRELEFTSLLKSVTRQVEPGKKNYKVIFSTEALRTLVDRLGSAGEFAIDLETTSRDPMTARIVGISLSMAPDEGYYIPVAHRYIGAQEQLGLNTVLDTFRPLLEDPKIKKFGQNIKYELIVLDRAGINLRGIAFDTMVASYLLNPNRFNHNLENIALEYLGYKMTTYEEVAGTGAKEVTFDMVSIPVAANYSCEDSDLTYQLSKLLAPKLKEQDLDKLFYEVELLLIPVLAEVEMNGFKIDVSLLSNMSKELEEQLADMEERIYRMAGVKFNINSPKQLADVLFTKLGLKPIKRTKTGYSTDEEVLTQLALHHELPAELLNYRQLAKLKSTYVDALPKMVNPQTNRIHTSLNQTVTATGRLSSSEPNLQNIPIRTELGRRIREAFIAEEGNLLMSADYSQIELRILAHMSGDEILIGYFERGEDIHTRTAVELFGLPPEAITPEMRRAAKTVNFGVIYGISPYGLATDLGISTEDAKRYIDNYFSHHEGVKAFIDKVVSEAKEKGYVTTILNRRRYIPELQSPNGATRGFGERTAINTPIQGSAADLIKVAMIKITDKIHEKGLRSKMILQVHDELVFEVPEEEVEVMKQLVKSEMEGVMPLKVPIKVDIGTGRNWNEAH